MEHFNAPIEKPQFTGKARVNGLLAPFDEGYLTAGYMAYENIPFGAVCREVPNSNQCTAGVPPLISEVAGIAVYDQSQSDRNPAFSDKYRGQMQCNVLYKGFCWYWNTNATGITKASKVFADTDTGEVGFGNTVPAGSTELKWVKIARIDEHKNGILVYVNIFCECGSTGTGDMPEVEEWAVKGSSSKIPQAKVAGMDSADIAIGEHTVTQTITLDCNEAFIGEENESKDNKIATISDLSTLATKKELEGKQPVGSYATVAQLEGYASASQLTTVNNKVTAIETRIGTAEGAIDMLQADMTTQKTKVENLITRVTALEGGSTT